MFKKTRIKIVETKNIESLILKRWTIFYKYFKINKSKFKTKNILGNTKKLVVIRNEANSVYK